jgi:hypothetical protein
VEPSPPPRTSVLRSTLIQVLKQIVRGQFDLLVTPLGCSIATCDQTHPMQTPEVPVHERMSSLRLRIGTLGEPQVPERILIPIVVGQKLVFGRRIGLAIGPTPTEHVLSAVDQRTGLLDCVRIDEVSRHSTRTYPTRQRFNRDRKLVPAP